MPRSPGSGQTVAGFARPALTCPDTATGGQVRDTFTDHPDAATVVLVDAEHRTVGSLDRNRFLLAVSGRYGFALHEHRPARDLADPPRTLDGTASPAAAMAVDHDSPTERSSDDVVITGPGGRVAGLARIGDLLRAHAELGYQHARDCHPLTGLPAAQAVDVAIEAHLARGDGAAAALLVPDHTAALGRGGFAHAGAELVALGRAVTEICTAIDGATAAHLPTGDLIILVDPARSAELDQALADRLAITAAPGGTRRAGAPHRPGVLIGWVRPPPGHHPTAAALAGQLLGLRARMLRGAAGDHKVTTGPGNPNPHPLPARGGRSRPRPWPPGQNR